MTAGKTAPIFNTMPKQPKPKTKPAAATTKRVCPEINFAVSYRRLQQFAKANRRSIAQQAALFLEIAIEAEAAK